MSPTPPSASHTVHPIQEQSIHLLRVSCPETAAGISDPRTQIREWSLPGSQPWGQELSVSPRARGLLRAQGQPQAASSASNVLMVAQSFQSSGRH